MKLEKIMSIVFYLINFIAVLFFFQYFFKLNTVFTAILLILYVFSYFLYQENKEKTLKEYYVEKEDYNILLREFMKILERKKKMVKVIYTLGKILYLIIILIIFITGICGISDVLEYFNITGFLNNIFTYVFAIYGIGMFFYDIDKTYNNKEPKNE